MRTFLSILSGAVFALPVAPCVAGDNELSDQEKAEGWQRLFNGKDKTGWKCSTGAPIATPIEDGCLQPHEAGGYLIVHEKQFGDFVLKCDVKMAEPYCNSGIFFRVSNLADPPRHGLECQITSLSLDPYGLYGAIYDLARPSKNMLRGNLWGWHTVEIRCKGPHITVVIDGETVTKMNCDEFTEKFKRPDGRKHKFNFAIKDLPRRGYIGFQDHGQKVWYKNVKIKELKN